MITVRDNGGGMDRLAMHRMMSFGVSSESSKRIGRYGNGFKSSSIRLAADSLVLSVCKDTGRYAHQICDGACTAQEISAGAAHRLL